jgi:hypothetical protein
MFKEKAMQVSTILHNALWRVFGGLTRFFMVATTLMHRFPDSEGFGQKMQEAELDYLVHSQALSKSLAENYVGLPLDFGQ